MATPITPLLELDVGDLDIACAFWRTLFDYEVTDRRRPGSPIESRTLVSRDVPLVLRLQTCLPRPPQGTSPGSIRTIEFVVDDPGARVARFEDPPLIHGPGLEPTADRIILHDPTGYHVALSRPPAGSG